MESGTITSIIMLVLMFAFILTFVRWMSLKRVNRFLKPLQSLAKETNSIITDYAIWNNNIIGHDKNTHHVFFIKTTEEKQTQQTIALSSVQKCHINNSSRSAINNQSIIEKLELVFTERGKNGTEISLEFYNAKHDNLTINEELQLIQKWSGIINDQLKTIN
ncbi:MAG TPA: hypothetical protein PLJ60_15015 [Chryseolinea sp.]|nr:hypothetical protein [Chryseolinea sp.]HPM31644.1 hypothetical protein [Chryseolinea sp.]